MKDTERKIMSVPIVTLVYSYYENAGMLKRHMEEWEKYPRRLREKIAVIVTDDCSPAPMQLTEFPKGLRGAAYRVTEKKPWNWLACRNIGAKHAKSDWLLLTDMDHMLSAQSMVLLLRVLSKGRLRRDFVYLFTRVDAPDNKEYKPHNDSFLMTKELYWKIGGYDEELAGNYGTSGRYRKRAYDTAAGHQRLEIPLTRFPREVIPDASTTAFVRKGKGRDPYAIRNIEKKKEAEGRAGQVCVLSFPYERLK